MENEMHGRVLALEVALRRVIDASDQFVKDTGLKHGDLITDSVSLARDILERGMVQQTTRDEKRWAALTFLHPMDVATVVCGAKDGTAMRQGLEALADKFISKATAAYK